MQEEEEFQDEMMRTEWRCSTSFISYTPETFCWYIRFRSFLSDKLGKVTRSNIRPVDKRDNPVRRHFLSAFVHVLPHWHLRSLMALYFKRSCKPRQSCLAKRRGITVTNFAVTKFEDEMGPSRVSWLLLKVQDRGGKWALYPISDGQRKQRWVDNPTEE